MITDVKTSVRSALLANDALITMLGGERIYQLAAPKADEFPRITFFEVTNIDRYFADDAPYASEIIIQIDVWSKESTSNISGEVDRTMKNQGWSRTLAIDQYEQDTEVYHKSLRYRNVLLEIE